MTDTAVQLTEAVGQFLIGSREPYKPSSKWFASGANMCWRQRWYQAKGYERQGEPDPAGEIVMDLGSHLHGAVEGALLRLGAELEIAWRDEELGLGGRADAVIEKPTVLGLNEHEDLPCVVEIKTLSDYGFKRAKEPEPRHVLQAAHSAFVLHAKTILIIYVSRENGHIATWLIDYDDGLLYEVSSERERIKQLNALKKPPHRVIPGTGEVADPLAASAPWNCRYCAYRATCAEAGA